MPLSQLSDPRHDVALKPDELICFKRQSELNADAW
tara:strand:- start:3689 stop:3793 length:105 start_codon:yes stop_codon:yes gene_type:complete